MFCCFRQQLEAMLNELKELPARLRMYDSYEYVRKLLQSYTKVCILSIIFIYFLNRKSPSAKKIG